MAKTVVTVWLQVTASPKLTVANGFSFTIATSLSISFDLIMQNTTTSTEKNIRRISTGPVPHISETGPLGSIQLVHLDDEKDECHHDK